MEIIESIVVIIASLVAVWGIIRWRLEEKWKRKYELAEEILASIYEFEQNVDYMRLGISTKEEVSDRVRQENETPEISRALDQAFIIRTRFNKNKEAYDKLRSLRFRFMAVYGKDHGKHILDFITIVNKVFSATDEFIWLSAGEFDYDPEYKRERLKEIRKILYSSSKEDPIKKELGEKIAALERICRTIIDKNF
ncbi:hypothetical protein [Salegentibacter sp. UBA1130]|uniref:hypothetical protein n=1 Tax=Salegentibacter sp. UBA1130 TaxID=1947451 RepID=UPI00257AB906|nr:hypothetical protein [Salegentibacter sp. UBA1130]